MKSVVPVLVLILMLGSLSTAGEDEAKTYLESAKKKCYDPMGAGLKSFSASVELRSSYEPKIMAIRDRIRVNYSWNTPDKEDLAFPGVPGPIQKGIRKFLTGMWKDLLTTPVFDDLAKAEKLSIEFADPSAVVTCVLKGFGRCRVTFDKATQQLKRFELDGRDLAIQLTHIQQKGLFHRSAKDTLSKGRRILRLSYEGFRGVNRFVLPTLVNLKDEQGRMTSFNIRYATINGKKAVVEDVSDEEVKKKVAEFKKNWRRWDDLEKVARIKELSKYDHDLATAALAKYALKDRDPAIRKEAARALGQMGRRNVVPSLISAMKPNRKYYSTYEAVIRALGQLNDARAVPILSKGWWDQGDRGTGMDAARAKIDALGDIRHKKSIEAILDVFYLAPDHALGRLAKNIVNSLNKLTGQNFGTNRRAWKDWWKRNKSTFRFE